MMARVQNGTSNDTGSSGRVAGLPAGARDPRERPVGVFDPGVGGLTVLHELLVQLPHEDFLYLGETARFRYSDRSHAELERLVAEVDDDLLGRGLMVLVVSCNPATPAAIPSLSSLIVSTTLGVDVLGVVRPEAF